MRSADLTGADLDGVRLTGCRVEGVVLERASTERVHFPRAQLASVNLFQVDLTGAELSGASFNAFCVKMRLPATNSPDLASNFSEVAINRARRSQPRGVIFAAAPNQMKATSS